MSNPPESTTDLIAKLSNTYTRSRDKLCRSRLLMNAARLLEGNNSLCLHKYCMDPMLERRFLSVFRMDLI